MPSTEVTLACAQEVEAMPTNAMIKPRAVEKGDNRGVFMVFLD
jgi:hypothetical protein